MLHKIVRELFGIGNQIEPVEEPIENLESTENPIPEGSWTDLETYLREHPELNASKIVKINVTEPPAPEVQAAEEVIQTTAKPHDTTTYQPDQYVPLETILLNYNLTPDKSLMEVLSQYKHLLALRFSDRRRVHYLIPASKEQSLAAILKKHGYIKIS